MNMDHSFWSWIYRWFGKWKEKRFPLALGGNNFEHQMWGAPWGQRCWWSRHSLIHMHSLGKMQNLKSMLSRITAEEPFSGEPKLPPALVVQLGGQQHSGAALGVEPASKLWKIFSLKQQTRLLQPPSRQQKWKQILRWFHNVATESDSHRFILKQSTEIYTNKTQADLWRCCSTGSDTYWLQPHSTMLILAPANNSCQPRFPLN